MARDVLHGLGDILHISHPVRHVPADRARVPDCRHHDAVGLVPGSLRPADERDRIEGVQLVRVLGMVSHNEGMAGWEIAHWRGFR